VDVADTRAVLGIPRVVPPVPLEDPGIGALVDLVRVETDRRKSTGDEGFPQALGRARRYAVTQNPPKPLPQDAPRQGVSSASRYVSIEDGIAPGRAIPHLARLLGRRYFVGAFVICPRISPPGFFAVWTFA
jgi:hypothetical protein